MSTMYDQEVQDAKHAVIGRFKEAGINKLLWPSYARLIAEEIATSMVEEVISEKQKKAAEKAAIDEHRREV